MSLSVMNVFCSVSATRMLTHPGYEALEVVFTHVRCLLADRLLCPLEDVAQESTRALKLLQQFHKIAALLLPVTHTHTSMCQRSVDL